METSTPETIARRFSSPTADELFLLCRPSPRETDFGRQAESAYAALSDALASLGVDPAHVVSETAYLRPGHGNFEALHSARRHALGSAERDGYRPAATFIGQAPLSPATGVEIAAAVLSPRESASHAVRDVLRPASCTCDACAPGTRARVVSVGGRALVYAGNIYGSGRDPFEQASDMFRVSRELLAEAGADFGDVLRTWIHLRDIERDYDTLNRARREFFRQQGLARLPASTGVEGAPCAAAHDFSMSFYAVKSSVPLDVTPLSTPLLNEAWAYGADFSRGLKLADTDKATLYVSGTASIDEGGRTIHGGDFAAQAHRMLDNIASLLSGQGAGFANIVSGVTYLESPQHAGLLRSICRERGFEGFPCALVEARLCRPDLLCETEAVAMLPFSDVEA